MTIERNFFYELSEKVRSLIANSVDNEERDWFLFGKKKPAVVLCGPDEEIGNANLKLHFLGYEVTNDTSGTFTAADANDDLSVYKMPSRILANYSLNFSDLDFKESIKVFDALTANFFNKRSIDSFIPESFKAIPPLMERMTHTADFSIKKAGVSATHKGYEMLFEYKGLYHSGNPIRSEKRVRQRKIEINKTEEGVL